MLTVLLLRRFEFLLEKKIEGERTKEKNQKKSSSSHLFVGQDLPASQARPLPVHLHALAEHLVQVLEGRLDAARDHGRPRVEVAGFRRRGEDV